MPLLEPDWNQPRPTVRDVREMCCEIQLAAIDLPDEEPFSEFIGGVRAERQAGGAFLSAFEVGSNAVFDWFASRNRLSEDRLLEYLVLHKAIAEAFPGLDIPESPRDGKGFGMLDPFLIDGKLANLLYYGGAYTQAKGDGQVEKKLAVEFCNAMFGLRYGEIDCDMSYDAWTPWFKGIAWDLTATIFDKRNRTLWMFVTTDTD